MLTANTSAQQCWRTIAQLARKTGIPENTFNRLALRVSRSGGDWVRKERRSQAYSREVWWIDAAHPEYRGWLATKKGVRPAEPQGSDDLVALCQRITAGEALSNVQARVLLARLEEVDLLLQGALRREEVERAQRAGERAALHALLATLRLLGLSVFGDVLDDSHAGPLLWRWGELHGEGSPTLVEAVQAALHARLGPPA